VNVDSIDLDASLDVDLDARFHLHCNEVHHVAEAASWSPGLAAQHTARGPHGTQVRAAGARLTAVAVGKKQFYQHDASGAAQRSADLHNRKYEYTVYDVSRISSPQQFRAGSGQRGKRLRRRLRGAGRP
jgi:hypothetical protein